MKDALTVEEFKALCELFFNGGMKWQQRLNVSAGIWEDRGELTVYNFEDLFKRVTGTTAGEELKLNEAAQPLTGEFNGSITSEPVPGIQLSCISTEARDLLDKIMGAWEPRYQSLRENNKGHEPGVYSFAYWLVRWSGLIQPANNIETK